MKPYWFSFAGIHTFLLGVCASIVLGYSSIPLSRAPWVALSCAIVMYAIVYFVRWPIFAWLQRMLAGAVFIWIFAAAAFLEPSVAVDPAQHAFLMIVAVIVLTVAVHLSNSAARMYRQTVVA